MNFDPHRNEPSDSTRYSGPPPPVAHPPGSGPVPMNRPSGDSRVLIVVGIVIVSAMVVFGGIIGFAILLSDGEFLVDSQPALAETREQKYETIRRMYQANDTLTLVLERELGGFFQAYGRILSSEATAPYMELFDFDRALKEGERRSGERLIGSSRREFIEGLEQNFRTAMPGWAAAYSYDDLEVHGAELLGDGAELVAYVRFRDSSDEMAKMRFWLARHKAGWKIFDYETLDTGVRLSQSIAESLEPSDMFGSFGLASRRDSTLGRIDHFGRVLESGTLEEADRIAESIDVAHLTVSDQVDFLIDKCRLDLQLDQFQDTIDAAGQVLAVTRDCPMAHLFAAQAFIGLQKYDAARLQLDSYDDLLGADAFTFKLRGDIFDEESQPTEALRCFRDALSDDPGCLRALYSLGLHLQTDNHDELVEAFSKFPGRSAAFEDLAIAYSNDYRWDLVRVLIDALSVSDGVNSTRDYMLARLNLNDGEYRVAEELLRPWLMAETENLTNDDFVSTFVSAAVESNPIKKVYSELPDKQQALILIGNELYYAEEPGDLGELTDLYAAEIGQDVHWLYYRAVYLTKSKEVPQAITLLTDRMDEIKQQEDAEVYYTVLMNAALDAHAIGGPTLTAAYEAIPDRSMAFDYLASRLDEDQIAALELLINTRRVDDPADTNLALHAARLLKFQKKPEQAFQKLVVAVRGTGMEPGYAFYQEFADLAFQTDKLMVAYQSVDDQETMFSYLTDTADLDKHLTAVEELIKQHALAFPRDTNVDSAALQVALHNRDWETALQLRERLLKSEEYPYDRRYLIVASMFEADDWQTAVETFDGDEEVFAQLARLSWNQNMAEFLNSIASSWSEKHSSSQGPELWQAAGDLLGGDLTRTADEVKVLGEKLQSVDSSAYYRQRILGEYLCRLNDLEPAAAFAKELDDDYGEPFLLAAVLIKSDKPTEAIKLLERSQGEYSINEFYDDRFLGDALKSPQGETVRAAFPPPTKDDKDNQEND